MSRTTVGHFTIIPRGRRARPHLAALRRSSQAFRAQYAAADQAGMERSSEVGWNALAALVEILRGEDDEGYIPGAFMQRTVGRLAEPVTTGERAAMITAARVDRMHFASKPLTLREALNKLIHYDSASATFRVDGRGAHYLVLGGARQKRHWVAELLMAEMSRSMGAAARAIRWHP